MDRPVYISSTSFESFDLRTVLALCENGGLEALELSSIEGWNRTLVRSVRCPNRLLVHNYFPPADPPFVLNLASRDASTLERSRAHCRAALDLSNELGGAVYAAHAGYTVDLAPESLGNPERLSTVSATRLAPRAEAYAILVESARELSAYGRARGVRFLIENHVLSAAAGERGTEILLMVEPDELEHLVRDVGDGNFGLLVDVGHLKVSATTLGLDPLACLNQLEPYIAAFHLSDNDGLRDSHGPFDDEAWFLPHLAAVPQATVTIELHRRSLEAITAVRGTVAAWL